MLHKIDEKILFNEGDNGIHTYRIPTLICTSNNVVLAFAEARHNSQGDAGQIDTVFRKSIDGGKSFGPIRTLRANGKDTLGNPALIYDSEINRVILLHCFNYGDLGEHVIRTTGAKRDIYCMYSDDEGDTWSEPVNITSSIKHPNWRWYATGPNHGVQMKSGRLIMTCNHSEEDFLDNTLSGPTQSHIIYSDDHGMTWKVGAICVSLTNECCGVMLPDNQLMVNMRTYDRGNYRCVFISSDEGQSIDLFYEDKNLVCPVCQASIINFQDKLVFSNPESVERKNMTVKVSSDFGRSWEEKLVLYESHSAYSDLTINTDGKILCLYENGDDRPYARISLATIEF
ncbi:MAG: exo-alpha-sialidase [Clostridia bacterium]|nr:exo-alpha-sialidase [Clostridia bacterium]